MVTRPTRLRSDARVSTVIRVSRDPTGDTSSAAVSVPLADEMLVAVRAELERREASLADAEAELMPLRHEVARLRHAVDVLEGRIPLVAEPTDRRTASGRRPRVRRDRSARIATIRQLLDSGERITGMVVAERLEVSAGYAQELLAVARREAAAEAAGRDD